MKVGLPLIVVGLGRTSFRSLLILLCLVFKLTPAFAQIAGIITNSKTRKPISDVEVFVPGTTHVALSDESGVFELQGLSPGFADLVLYSKGYNLFKSSIRLQEGKAYSLNLSLDPAPKTRPVKGPVNSSEQGFQRLKEALVGKENDNATILLNAESVTLPGDKNVFTVQASEPLMVNNFLLGYQLRYFLMQGSFSSSQADLKGYFYFLPMQATGSVQDREWAETRLAKYHGSMRHFLRSLVSGTSANSGFQCLNKKGGTIDPGTLTAPSKVKGYYNLLLPDTMKVIYKSSEISSQLISHGLLAVNAEGVLLKSENLEINGAMKTSGIIEPLPLNYEPFVPQDEDYTRFYEKVYVHTDKPYYYPGEPLWFKGYINYQIPSWRDSLSKVIYVEIINAKKKIILSRTLKIDSGFFNGDFLLPDTLPGGSYYLRSYTNLNRNFGTNALFIKPVPVLNMTDKADPAQEVKEPASGSHLTIIPEKTTYRTREKITLSFQLKDSTGLGMGSNLSVSVTDAEQVVPLRETASILSDFPFSGEMMLNNMDFRYGAEFGVSFQAKFLNDKGQPERTNLNILQMKTSNMMLAQTDNDGVFWRTGLDFYDTAKFSFKSDKAKGRPYGKVVLLNRETPDVDLKGFRTTIAVNKTELPQRLISEYEVPKDTKLLEAVTVKGTRIDDNRVSEGFTSHYGTPDRVIKGDEVSMKPDLLYALVGKVPGLTIIPSTGVVVFARAVGSSITNSAAPLITVNDVPMDGDAGEILRSINPVNVDRIAFTRRIDVLYGSQGRNGVIAVYTKMGTTGFEDPEKEKNFQVLGIPGYSRTRIFRSPDYDDPRIDKTKPDYRATLYWNPWVITDDKTGETSVTFYSADLEGRYRVVVEGVSRRGEPVRVVSFINVENQ